MKTEITNIHNTNLPKCEETTQPDIKYLLEGFKNKVIDSFSRQPIKKTHTRTNENQFSSTSPKHFIELKIRHLNIIQHSQLKINYKEHKEIQPKKVARLKETRHTPTLRN